MYGLVDQHLPMLQAYVNRIVNGQDKLFERFTQDILPHAINLQIGPDTHNEEELPQDLVCSCGCEDFTFDKLSIGKISCNNCQAKFVFDHNANRFMPTFICEACGCNTEDKIDEIISKCANCDAGYVNGVMMQ
ncbi:hypothetical protein D3C75_333360 [compost metagenome]